VPNQQLSLIVDGKKYEGWESAQITRSIEAIASGFSLAVTDRWNIDKKPLPILPEMSCVVTYGEDTILSGFIDDANPSGSATDHSITVSGRSKTEDLVDCSVIDCPSEFKKCSLLYIVEKICSPYGIVVSSESSGASALFPADRDGSTIFSIQPAEKCFDAIERACRSCGYFPTENFKGEILLARAGSAKISSPLIYGKNIKSYSGKLSSSERYKKYILIAQHPGSDTSDAATIAQIKAEASDNEVTRNRVLKIIAQKAMTQNEAQLSAYWHAAVAAGRSKNVTVVVQGWRDGDGNLWEHNKLIDIYLPPVFNSEKYFELLITNTVFSLDEKSGTTATLQLKPRDACLPEPLKPNKTKSAGDPWAALRADLAGAR
jgi:prophage tail gpP-like protein